MFNFGNAFVDKMNLPQKTSEEIEALSESGNVLSDSDDFEGAIGKWKAALQLRWDDARDSFYDALNAEDGRGNPFVHYRLGQCLVNTGDERKGLESLLKAYMLDGEDIFNADEPDGLMYLKKLRDVKLID